LLQCTYTFKSLIKQSILIDDATWLLGSTYLKMKEKELAKQSSQELICNKFAVTPKEKHGQKT